MSGAAGRVFTCPTLSSWNEHAGRLEDLAVYYMDVTVEIHVAIAFVSIRTSYLNMSPSPITGLFQLPTAGGRATVCSCDISFAGKTFSTSVIDPSANKFEANKEMTAASAQCGKNVSTFDPDVFTMPFANAPGNAEVIVEVKYIQNLDFNCTTGDFFVSVPTLVPNHMMYNHQLIEQCTSISCLLNPGTTMCQWTCSTHDMQKLSDASVGSGGQQISLNANKHDGMPNAFFEIGYHAWASAISGSCIFQPPAGQDDGAFILFVSPPAASAMTVPMRRRVVFLLDHSGSMGGQPMMEAREALCVALDQLQPFDEFNVVAFDDQMQWYSQGLVPAAHHNVGAVKQWVRRIDANGGTDILQAYSRAHEMLTAQGPAPHGHDSTPLSGVALASPIYQQGQGGHGSHGAHGHAPPSGFAAAVEDKYRAVDSPLPRQTSHFEGGSVLPIIILVTDGAVSNEKDICSYAHQQAVQHPDCRTYTFGIGPFCNKYFLKMLACEGRGHSDVCLTNATIASQMGQLMSKTMGPVLVDVSLAIDGIDDKCIHLYPEKVPDLTVGAPLILAGHFSNSTFSTSHFPASVRLTGSDSQGQRQTIVISASQAESAPVSQLVDKIGLDILIGKAWMAHGSEKDALEKQARERSINSSIPCPFTQSVAYQNHDFIPLAPGQARPVPHGFTPTRHDDPHPPQPHGPGAPAHAAVTKKRASPAMVGGGIVLGSCVAASLVFGSIAATNSNISIGDLSSIFSSIDMSGVGNFDFGSLGNIGMPNIDMGNIGMPGMPDLPDPQQCCCCDISFFHGLCGDTSCLQGLCGCNPMDICGQNCGSCVAFGQQLLGPISNGDCGSMCACVGQLDCGSVVSSCSESAGPLLEGAGNVCGVLLSCLGD